MPPSVLVSAAMRGRFTTSVLLWLLVVAVVSPPFSAAIRADHELIAARAGSERLYLPTSSPLTQVIVVSARAEAATRIERRRLEAAAARGFVEREGSFDGRPCTSYDKRPLPRALDDPPQPNEHRSLRA